MAADKEREEDEQDIQPIDEFVTTAPAIIPLSPSTELDLSSLPESQRNALVRQFAEGQIEVAKKAAELQVDVKSLEHWLGAMSDQTQEMTKSGTDVTIAQTQESSMGRTEILIGNTERAKSGKFSKTQTGEKDWTPYYILGGLIAVTLIGVAIANGL